MRSWTARALLAVTILATLAVLVPAPNAEACFSQCVRVGPGFCRRCLEVEEFTGVACQDSGACGCFYVQVVCREPAPGSATRSTDLAAAELFGEAEAAAATPEAPSCTAELSPALALG